MKWGAGGRSRYRVAAIEEKVIIWKFEVQCLYLYATCTPSARQVGGGSNTHTQNTHAPKNSLHS